MRHSEKSDDKNTDIPGKRRKTHHFQTFSTAQRAGKSIILYFHSDSRGVWVGLRKSRGSIKNHSFISIPESGLSRARCIYFSRASTCKRERKNGIKELTGYAVKEKSVANRRLSDGLKMRSIPPLCLFLYMTPGAAALCFSFSSIPLASSLSLYLFLYQAGRSCPNDLACPGEIYPRGCAISIESIIIPFYLHQPRGRGREGRPGERKRKAEGYRLGVASRKR